MISSPEVVLSKATTVLSTPLACTRGGLAEDLDPVSHADGPSFVAIDVRRAK